MKDGAIFAAGLDVTDPEPPSMDDGGKLPNVVIAPHIAIATVEGGNQMAKICAEPDRQGDGMSAAGVE